VLDWEEPGLTFRASMTNGHKYVRFSCMRESLRIRSEWHYLKSPSTIMFWKWKQAVGLLDGPKHYNINGYFTFLFKNGHVACISSFQAIIHVRTVYYSPSFHYFCSCVTPHLFGVGIPTWKQLMQKSILGSTVNTMVGSAQGCDKLMQLFGISSI